MSTLLSRCQDISRLTNGYFDVTIGQLTKLWRRAFRRNEFPSKQEVEEALGKVGFQNLEIYPNGKLKINRQGLSFDFGGVAKGLAVDQVFEYLKQNGVDKMLIDGGGDIRVGEAPLNSPGWVISLDKGKKLSLENIAIASSGSTFKFMEWEGKKYSHIIDPKVGYGITNPNTITVKASSCVIADVIATTYSIAGKEGIAGLMDPPIDSYIEIIK